MDDPLAANSPLRFPTVFFARYQVWRLSPSEIDDMLANGWFRSDLHVHTSAARFVNNFWRSSLMVRIPLVNFRWKKSLRKILRRNHQRFSVKIQVFEPRTEVEQLWQKFKTTVHQWEQVPELTHHIFRGSTHTASFNTMEVAVYDNQRLVAFSLFDRGEQSIASLEAAYDPEYHQYSLGIFTMLTEIEFCLANRMSFYYPGFYPKGVPMFDYKLRPGPAQFYRAKEQRWVPWSELQPTDWLLDQVMLKLRDARSLLKSYGVNCSVKVFNITNFPGVVPAVTDYNILLAEDAPYDTKHPILLRVAWDPIKEAYFLFSKESGSVNILSSPGGNAKTSSFGPPFYFDSQHASLTELDERIGKIITSE